jgi:hypothetical protein
MYQYISRWKDSHSNYLILIDRRQQSSVLDVQSFRAADCDTDHYLMVTKGREKMVVSKQQCTHFIGEVQCQEIKRCRGLTAVSG